MPVRFVGFAGIAAVLALFTVLTGCGGSTAGVPRTSAVLTSPVADPSTAVSSTGSTVSPAPTGPAVPTVPAVPADVPTTGPNLTVKGEKPPVLPLEATRHTQGGAVAFAEFFVRTIDWGYATISSSYMRHYFSPACVACVSLADGIDSAAAKHHRFIGDRISVMSASARTSGDGAGVTVRVNFAVTSGEVVDASGNFVDGAPALKQTVDLAAHWTGDMWSVRDWVPVM